jgi:glycosyltransferase involved in cell wall biosynthesis
VKVCVVICTYRRFNLLPKAIESAMAQSYPKADLHIIVVDNSGQPILSQEFAARYTDTPDLTYLIEPQPGLSRARNVGWRATSADIIAYMDDDAVADPDWIARLVDAYHIFGEQAGAVGGMVKPIWVTARPAWLHPSLEGYLSVVDWGGQRRIAGELEWLAGTNISFRRSLLAEFCGFDENLGRTEEKLLSNEEIGLTSRIRASGRKTIYAPEAIVHHMISEERLSHDWFRRRVFWQAISDLLMQSDPHPVVDYLWDGVAKYFVRLPLTQRTPAGFFANLDEAGLFRDELGAIYNLAKMLGYGLPCPATEILAPASRNEG